MSADQHSQNSTTVAPNGDFLKEMPHITRVDVIDYRQCGLVYTNRFATNVALSVQDDGRTLKVFVGKSE